MTTGSLLLGPAGRVCLDPTARTLSVDAERVAIGARALDVLTALAEAGGELVTKEQLLQRCWPGLVVEEANVHVQVSALRKLLGADAIATVPGLGYRLAWPAHSAVPAVAAHNLPSRRTRFIGREAALDQARQRLQQTRLLTFIGIGGTGKTRLAIELARQTKDDHADGAWWVDIAPLDRPEQVAAATAQALGLMPHQGLEPVQAVSRWLQPKRLLLVLDNCEHLLDAVAQCADAWLAAAPDVRLVVTSREALGLQGELVFPVAPLALPPGDAGDAQILDAEAVQLLIDRAALATPGFELGAGEARIAAEICRRVDGIPLALELAAVQLRVVAPAQLLDLLQERFRLLTQQRRALPRQQTMQAVITWSYERLHADEKSLLHALALCSGGCDLDGAAALMAPELPRSALLAGLSRLAEQSLLQVQHGAGAARYHLLETVRQFAFDHMRDGDQSPLLRERHALHYLALAEASWDEAQRSGDAVAPLARIDLERENLLRAIDTCVHDDIADAARIGLRLMAALSRYWLARGLGKLGTTLGLAVLARAEPLPVEPLTIGVMNGTAYLLWVCGRLDEAQRLALRAVQLAEAGGDRNGLAGAHRELGSILIRLGRHDEGQAEHETACRMALEVGDRDLYADTLCRMGNLAATQGRVQDAVRYFDEALPIRLASGQGWRIVGALLFAASLAVQMGETARARDLLRQAAAVLPRVGSVQYDVYLVDHTARLAALEGQWSLVAQLIGAATQLPHAPPPVQGNDEHARSVLLQQARSALGAAGFDGAWAAGSGSSLAQAVALAAAWLGPALPISPGR